MLPFAPPKNTPYYQHYSQSPLVTECHTCTQTKTHLKMKIQRIGQAVKVTTETPASITPMAILHTIADLLPLPIFKKKTSHSQVE